MEADWMWLAGLRSNSSDDSDDAGASSSSSSYSVDGQDAPWKGETEQVSTSYGVLHVTLCGDRRKPPLITYHDIGLNHTTCFQGLLLCTETAGLLLSHFSIYHIDAPGHEDEADEINAFDPRLTVEELSDQVYEVAQFYGLEKVSCMGVTAGAYILTLFAIKYPQMVDALILISPLCRAPSWSEWTQGKLLETLLCFYGHCDFVKDALLRRYFCPELQQKGFQGPASDTLMSFEKALEDREPENVVRFLEAMNSRFDLTPFLPNLLCPVLCVTGESSPYLSELQHFQHHVPSTLLSCAQVPACGSLVSEERPHRLYGPLEVFLTVSGLISSHEHKRISLRSSILRSSFSSGSSSSASSPPSAEDLCLSAFAERLRPIKTRSYERGLW